MNLWYTARGAGLATLLAFTLATTLGALGSRKTADVARRVVLQYVHRSAAGLGLGLLLVHVTSVVLDNRSDVTVAGALVPFASSYRPGAVALGSITAYLLVTVSALGLARGRIAASPAGARTWRAVHALAYLGWGTAVWHGFTAGEDTDLPWVRLLYVVCVIVVPLALASRLATDTVLRPMTPIRSPR